MALACVAGGFSKTAESQPLNTPVVITRSGPLLPGCGLRRVVSAFTSTLAAFNTNHLAQLDAAFAPSTATKKAPAFVWFSDNEDHGLQIVRRRSQLLRYLATRRISGVRFIPEILAASVTRRSGIALAFVLEERLNPVQPPEPISGKAELACPAMQFYVWSMSITKPPAANPTGAAIVPCPLPGGWQPSDSLVACVSQ